MDRVKGEIYSAPSIIFLLPGPHLDLNVCNHSIAT